MERKTRRTGRDLGAGNELSFDWKQNEAVVLSFDPSQLAPESLSDFPSGDTAVSSTRRGDGVDLARSPLPLRM